MNCRENDSIDDYDRSNGIVKDRRFAEGSTCISRKAADGSLVYLLLYSANYFASENCELSIGMPFDTILILRLLCRWHWLCNIIPPARPF
jgi:hypothetical protein